MRRPFADKRPIGPVEQIGNSQLVLYVEYTVDYELGLELENDRERRQIEESIEDQIQAIGFVNADVELMPAGRTVGAKIRTGADTVDSQDEDDMLDILDDDMGEELDAVRNVENEGYEWMIE